MMDFNVEDKNNDGMMDNTEIPMEQAGQMDINNDGKISPEEYEQSVRSSPLGQQYEYTYGHPWNMQTKNWDIGKKYPSDVWAKEYNIQEPKEPQYNPNYEKAGQVMTGDEQDFEDVFAKDMIGGLNQGRQDSELARHLEKNGVHFPKTFWKNFKDSVYDENTPTVTGNWVKKNLLPKVKQDYIDLVNETRPKLRKQWEDEYNKQKDIYDRWHSWKPSDLTEALKEGNEEKAEQITEEAPEMAKETVPDTPLATEAEQITNDTDKRNDEVNNTALKDTIDDFQKNSMEEMLNRDPSANLPAPLADVEEATLEEEDRWNRKLNGETSELAPQGKKRAVDIFNDIMNSPKEQLGLPSPHIPETETQGLMEKIKNYPPVKIGHRTPIKGDTKGPLPPLGDDGGFDLHLKLGRVTPYMPSTKGDYTDDFKWNRSPVSFDKAKDILKTLSGRNASLSHVGVGGVDEAPVKMPNEAPSYSKGKEIPLPESGTATSSTGPTTKMFNDIMSGKGKGGSSNPFVSNSKPMKKGRHKTVKGHGSLHKGENQQTPSIGRLRGSGTSENTNAVLFDRLQEFIRKNYMHWRHNKHGYVWEKGAISIYVNDAGITIKYGSYGRETLDVFFKQHPDKLRVVIQEMNAM